MNNNKQLRLSVALAALVYSSTGAAQQSKATPVSAQKPRSSIEEVLVTARKIAESAQTIPVSLTTLTPNELADRNVIRFTDLRNVAPNLNIQANNNDNQTVTISMRGQRQRGVQLTLDQSVGVYVDGFYYARPIGLADTLVDAERVEVLRGPQGTLYGKNTTGGAISIYTADPGENVAGSAEITVGNYDLRSFTGVANVPLNDSTGLRLVAKRSVNDGYGSTPAGDRLEDHDLEFYRAKIKSQLGDKVSVEFSAAYTKNDSGGPRMEIVGFGPGGTTVLEGAAELAGVGWWQFGADPAIDSQVFAQIPAATEILNQSIDGDYSTSASNTKSHSVYEGMQYLLDIEAEFSDSLSFRSISGYHDFKKDSLSDFDGTPFQVLSVSSIYDDAYYSQEFQLIGNADDIDWVAGLYYSSEDGEGFASPRPQLPALTGPNADNYSAHNVTNTSEAVFGQANWSFLPDWRLSLGLRYSSDGRKLEANNVTAGNCVVPAPGASSTLTGPSQCPRTFEEDYKSPSWLISLDHQFSDSVMAFAKVSKGYRSGGLNYNGQIYSEAFEGFEPEIVTEYELGIKSELLDNQLRVNASVYYSDYSDIQRAVIVPTASGGIAVRQDNAAEATVKGFETDVVWQASEALSLRLSSGYTKAEFDSYDVLGTDRSNEKFPVPEWSNNVNARYVQNSDYGEWRLNLDYYWQSETDFSHLDQKPELSTQESYGIVNARISLYLNAINAEISLFGRNLADKDYFVEANNNYGNLGMVAVMPGEPRIYGLQFKKTFGDL